MKKQILWVRVLDCGHERTTNLAFISGIYSKPKVGTNAYCRECMKQVKIVKVKKASNKDVKELKMIMKENRK